MKKMLTLLLSGISLNCLADASGVYLGGGLGYGMQTLSYINNTSSVQASPAMRLQVGYQFADWIDAEFGWNYLTQGGSWQNLAPASSTIYDLSFTPGFTLPATPITVFVRLGIDAVSTNLNSSWYNQIISNSSPNFEYGAGVKVAIPETRTFIRAEYINYGGSQNNNNNNLITTPTAIMIDAAYVF